MSDQVHLMKSKRFLPLFLTQFLGAFNDNVFKNALVILITYFSAEKLGIDSSILVTLAAGIFILPFFLFSAIAGQVADKFEKSQLIRVIKTVEICLMAIGMIGFYTGQVYLLLFVLFMMGTQSAFFGPLKYSILPDHLREDELISGNAIVEAGTFLAILLGTILGGVLILTANGVMIISMIVVLISVIGLISSYFIPKAEIGDKDLVLSKNIFKETYKIIKQSQENDDVFLSILGISWFWLVGFTYLAQFPNYGRDVIGGNEHVVTLFLAIFSIGIGIGSLICNKLLRGKVSGSLAPFGALGMSIFTITLYLLSPSEVASGDLIGIPEFLSSFQNLLILGSMLMVSIFGGIYIVPLYAIIQSRSNIKFRSRIIASNNIINALFMVGSAIVTMVLLAMGMSINGLFLTIGLINLPVSFIVRKIVIRQQVKNGTLELDYELNDKRSRRIARWVLTQLYDVEIEGIANFKKAGKRVLIISNHLSFLDAALLAVFMPEKVMFAVNTFISQKWWMKPFLALVDAYPLDPTNPMATKSLIKEMKNDRKCVIFPEGRITVTGSLMKVYEGPGMIADKSDANLLPVRLEGAQYSKFSRLRGKVRTRWFPKITIKILPPQKFKVPAEIKGKKRRALIGRELQSLMTKMIFDSSDYKKTLFKSLLDARSVHGGGHEIALDVERQPINYRGLTMKSYILGKKLANKTSEGEYVGLLMPNMLAGIISLFGLQAFGRVPAMLNFSAGVKNILSACVTAELKSVITSKKFIKLGKLDAVIEVLEENNIKILYLEDIGEEIGFEDKLKGFLWNLVPDFYYALISEREASDPGIILFTSGSEGNPKAVVLSHENIQANRYQLSSMIDFGPTDTVFNALPIFHSFGLTAGTLLPLLSGIKTFFYPSPLHYRIVPELVYDSNATIMFGTDTFLSGYARFANPYDFYAIRYVFAGAEKLKEETRKVWAEKFGVRIFEGYGATETAPVLAANTPMFNKAGTVGKLMPSIIHKLEAVPGIEDGGKLIVKGPNVMIGYLLSDKPGKLVKPKHGWYDTGDIVEFDEEGFIKIKGRAKRFAKIAGEMVSLTAVETEISQIYPEHNHAVIAIPDKKKGEALVLITENKKYDKMGIAKAMRENGNTELAIPKKFLVVDLIPLLGTGKIDYVSAQLLANDI